MKCLAATYNCFLKVEDRIFHGFTGEINKVFLVFYEALVFILKFVSKKLLIRTHRKCVLFLH